MKLKDEQKFQITLLQSKFVWVLEQRASYPLDFDKMFECLKMLYEIQQTLKQIVSKDMFVQHSMLTAGLSSVFSHSSSLKSSSVEKVMRKHFYDETMKSVMSWAFNQPPVVGFVVHEECAGESTSRFFRRKSITENKLTFVVGYSDNTFFTVHSIEDESVRRIMQESFESKVMALQDRRQTV